MNFITSGSTATESARDVLNRLIAQRDALEAEADAIYSELTSPGLNGEPPAGVKTSLIDAEGYPRGDIDIINVKNKRRRLAEINTDHKALMKQIEQSMVHFHETLPAVPAPALTSESVSQIDMNLVSGPMAKLDQVLEGSPAADAGIREDDLLLQFGTITSNTEAYLNSIVQLVGRNVNQPIPIVVQRTKLGSIGGTERLALSIVPKPWGGRGLMGCHLTPIQQ